MLENQKTKTPKTEKKVKLGENQITRGLLVEAYRFSECGTWRDSIRNILSANALAGDDDIITIPNTVINLFVRSATYEQREYVKKLGITLRGDKNIFLQAFSSTATEELSRKLFGDSYIFQIMEEATPDEEAHLKGRAFFIHSNYNVRLFKGKSGCTGIELTRK